LVISDQLTVLRNYPRLFTEEEGIRLVDPVTLAEIFSTLKGFKYSKSPGPDGWTVEFFLAFFISWVMNYWRWWKSRGDLVKCRVL
jgi:hypothetical protein